MVRSFSFLVFLLSVVIFFAFFIAAPKPQPAAAVKKYYLQLCNDFILSVKNLQAGITMAGEKELQQKFYRVRMAYKKTELFTEYFFSYHTVKLNGPPIPFFEESEADVPESKPGGMQVIEGLLFPHYKKEAAKSLKSEVDELLRYAIELPSIHESFEFTDVTVFDALMEEVYRVTALGIAGFDSQTAQNSLPECAAALNSVQQVLYFYKEAYQSQLPGKFELLEKKLSGAIQYISINKDFLSFNRMQFITAYLNPVAKLIGAYKIAAGLKDNAAGQYYSALQKNNTLFTAGAFDAYRFLDDYQSSPEKIELGRMLFFDTRLSADNSRSCASCHQPSKAFTDGLKTSLALDGHIALPRNAPTLWNAALQRSLFYDSRSRTLEDQVLQVLNNAKEMHGSAQTAAEKIIKQEKYKNIYDKAFPGEAGTNTVQNICNAIACYERTLIALNSRFDKQMNGEPVLHANEINGFNLFMGKARCGTCHFMPLFSGAKPPRYYYTESEVIGVPATADKIHPELDSDSGRYLTTGFAIHLHAFKTPTLRNAALTAPYMHNGVFTTLEAVVDFYNEGGGRGLKIAPQNQSLPFDKLGLTKKEKADIVSFMRTLTDTSTVY